MIYATIGFALVGLGLIGAVLPLLPTTIFFILAVPCFARSNPRVEAWIRDHPRFGPPVQAWHEHGAISVPAKWMALAGMAFGYGVFLVTTAARLPLALGVGVALGGCALYVVTRPSGPR